MSERKSLWNLVVSAIVILPMLYWASAPATLWTWKHTRSGKTPLYFDFPPNWWSSAYYPVLWAADQPMLEPITMKPFEWLDVDGLVFVELHFNWHHGTISIEPLPPLFRKRKTTNP